MLLNPFVLLFPALFGCRRVILTDTAGLAGLEKVLALLKEMDAVKIGESGMVDLGNYYFKVGGKWVVLVEEEYTDIRLVAPDSVIKRIQHGLHEAGRP